MKRAMGDHRFFCTQTWERGPQGLGGVEASSENAGQPSGVGRQGQENAEDLFELERASGMSFIRPS